MCRDSSWKTLKAFKEGIGSLMDDGKRHHFQASLLGDQAAVIHSCY